ncbi:MAG: hypothetical protein JW821_12085 [Deltaproteobacteria bacterium]|nr:hypothetical protein [Deltaproteobacteria bacterium]
MEYVMHLRLSRLCVVLPALTLLGPACIPQPHREVLGPVREAESAPVPTAAALEERVERLQRLLASGQLEEGDRNAAAELLQAYRSLQSALPGSGGESYDAPEIRRILFEALGRMEQRYLTEKGPSEGDQSEIIRRFHTRKRTIMDAYLGGNYEEVVQGCTELEAVFGPDVLTGDLGVAFAISLAKRGRVKEASEVGRKVLGERRGRADLLDLQAQMIQWQLALGNRDLAKALYERLMDGLKEREALRVRASRMLGEERGAPAPRDTSVAEGAPGGGPSRTETPLAAVLREVDDLVRKREFSKARFLLLREKIRTQEGPDLEILERAMREVENAEGALAGPPGAEAATPPEDEGLKAARDLIEKEEYEAALARLRDIEEVRGGPDPSLMELRRSAEDKLILKQRNRAAKLFLAARNAGETSEKKDLLLASHGILKDLIERFPSSALITKLRENLEAVRQELAKLGMNPD